MTLFLIFWLAFFGAVIGSFLNVVVYRLPLGKSLVSPPSQCPKCSHRIRWFDNVPVFGWLMLGGKCRDCKEPISIRYPLVEFFCGLVFGLLAFLTLEKSGDADVRNLLALAGIQSVLIVSLFAIGLIEFDQKPIPWTVLVPSIVLIPFAMYFASDASSPIPGGYRFFASVIDAPIFFVFVLVLIGILGWFAYRRYYEGIIFCVGFVLVGCYFGELCVPILGCAVFTFYGCVILNVSPMRCRFLVLSFVTFGVLCVALIW